VVKKAKLCYLKESSEKGLRLPKLMPVAKTEARSKRDQTARGRRGNEGGDKGGEGEEEESFQYSNIKIA
jgi:hypothetical protein